MRARLSHAERRRAALVATVASILDQGQPTRFAYEGACRHGVRVAFILGSGMAWRAADDTAAEIIEAAFKKLGVSRPSWLDGQPEAVEPVGGARFTCARCGKPMPTDDSRSTLRKFCSPLCQKAAANDKTRLMGVQRTWAEELARRAAQAEATKAKARRACAWCRTDFLPKRKGQECCSRRCGNRRRAAKG